MKLIISLSITLALALLLFSQINLSQIVDILANLNPIYLLVAVLSYGFVLLLRAIRFSVLLKLETRELVPIVMTYNLLNYMLPFKIGELSLPYMLKKIKKHSFTKALSCLIIARSFDFIIVILMLLSGFLVADRIFTELARALPMVLLLLVFLMSLTYLLIFKSHYFVLLISKIKLSKFEGIKEKFITFLKNFESLKSEKLLMRVFILSFLAFITGLINTYLILLSLGYNVAANNLLLIVPIGVLSGILPLQGILGLGTFESFWIAGFVLMGYSLPVAVLISLGIHVIQLVSAGFFGLIGWLKIRKSMLWSSIFL
ncbi:flippase-like domain-containing protein [Candidatus Woesearchaeota archaeon]|nr:flippase-like domain-containing protein [Candidatus Woesearchaeota archaeon]